MFFFQRLFCEKGVFCYECNEFLCELIKNLAKRYETLYHMNMVDNLQYMKEQGLTKFLETEKKKWECTNCGQVICCHNGICYSCDLEKMKTKKKLYRWEDYLEIFLVFLPLLFFLEG